MSEAGGVSPFTTHNSRQTAEAGLHAGLRSAAGLHSQSKSLSLEDALAAAVDGTTEVDLKSVLEVNPDHFGTTGDTIMDNIIDSVLLNVTGGIDPLSAGTGGGSGYNQSAKAADFNNDNPFFNDDLFGGLRHGAPDPVRWLHGMDEVGRRGVGPGTRNRPFQHRFRGILGSDSAPLSVPSDVF